MIARKFWSAVGVLLSLLIMTVSGVCNARYGMSLAREGFDEYVMIAAAGFADLGKAVCWIFFASALARREWLASLASLFIFVFCLGYAVAGSLGYVALHRSQSAAGIESKNSNARSIEDELARKKIQLAKLGFVEPSSVLESRIQSKQQDRRFSQTSECSTATLESSRLYCSELATVTADLRKSIAVEKLEDEIAKLNLERAKLGVVTHVDRGDFQSSIIAQISGVSMSNVQLSLSLIFVVLVESASCFLLWISINHGTTKKMNPPGVVQDCSAPTRALTTTIASQVVAGAAEASDVAFGDLAEFVDGHLDLHPCGKADVAVMHSTYRDWCVRGGRRALPDEQFSAGLNRFCKAGGFERVQDSSGQFVIGVVIVKSTSEETNTEGKGVV